MSAPHTKKTRATALIDQLGSPKPSRYTTKQVDCASIVSDLNRIRNEAVRLLKTITSAGQLVAADPRVNVSPWKEQVLPLATAVLKDGRGLESNILEFDARISAIATQTEMDVVFNDALVLTQDIACTIENYQNATVPMIDELFRIQQSATQEASTHVTE